MMLGPNRFIHVPFRILKDDRCFFSQALCKVHVANGMIINTVTFNDVTVKPLHGHCSTITVTCSTITVTRR